MATQNFDAAPQQTTDPQFRAWILALNTAIAAILTAVTQTGEIDFTTVAFPNGVNQKRGFRVFRFNDALQATHPVFIRIDYGSGAAATTPSVWVTVGQTTDGSGNIGMLAGGTTPTATQMIVSSTSASVFTTYISGDSSRLTFALFMAIQSVSQAPATFNIERVKDNAGLNLVDGVVWQCYSGSSGLVSIQTMTPDGQTLSNINSDGRPVIPFSNNRTSAALNLKVSMFSLIHYSKSTTFNGVTGVLIYHDLDFGPGSITISVYGANINYLLMGRSNQIVQTGSTHRMALRND